MSAEIEAAILEICEARGPNKTACPSEVARQLDPEHWRRLMESVRVTAEKLAAEGKIVVTQTGAVVDLSTARGPIRLRIAR